MRWIRCCRANAVDTQPASVRLLPPLPLLILPVYRGLSQGDSVTVSPPILPILSTPLCHDHFHALHLSQRVGEEGGRETRRP